MTPEDHDAVPETAALLAPFAGFETFSGHKYRLARQIRDVARTAATECLPGAARDTALAALLVARDTLLTAAEVVG